MDGGEMMGGVGVDGGAREGGSEWGRWVRDVGAWYEACILASPVHYGQPEIVISRPPGGQPERARGRVWEESVLDMGGECVVYLASGEAVRVFVGWTRMGRL